MTAHVRPVSETNATFTLCRKDYEALLDELAAAQDPAAVRVGRAHEAQTGYESARNDYLTADESRRLLDGQHPVKIWREKRACPNVSWRQPRCWLGIHRRHRGVPETWKR